MKKQITFAILLFSSFGAFAQVTREELDKEIKPLTENVKTLQSGNSKLKSEIVTLNTKLSVANTNIDSLSKSIDSLRNQMQVNDDAIAQTASELGIKIKETGDQNAGEINKVSDSLSINSLYGIIGVLSSILLSGLLY